MTEIEKQAEELAKKYKVPKVHIYVGEDGKDKVIGFLKEPTYLQKIVAMDKMGSAGPFIAGDELREVITLKEESDPRTYSTDANCDKYRLGMTSECIALIEVAVNSYKKK